MAWYPSNIDNDTDTGDIIKTKLIQRSISVPASQSTSWNCWTDTGFVEEGWTPLGIISIYTGHGDLVPVIWSIVNNPYSFIIRNLGSTNATATFQYWVLYKKA